MSENCYTTGDFDRLLELIEEHPDGHEDLQHLESCAECRSQLDFYRSFLDQGAVPEGADLADASRRLDTFLEQEIAGTAKSSQGPAPANGRRVDLRRWSPVLVAACLVCTVLLINYRNDHGPLAPSGTVRERSAPDVTLETSQIATAAGFVLTWTGPADADSLEIVILDASMTEIERFPVDPSGEYDLDRADHRWLRDAGPFFWFMVGLRDGDEIARSSVGALEPVH